MTCLHILSQKIYCIQKEIKQIINIWQKEPPNWQRNWRQEPTSHPGDSTKGSTRANHRIQARRHARVSTVAHLFEYVVVLIGTNNHITHSASRWWQEKQHTITTCKRTCRRTSRSDIFNENCWLKTGLKTVHNSLTRHAVRTYNASCSTPMPTRRPAIAPTAILGMNRPAGT